MGLVKHMYLAPLQSRRIVLCLTELQEAGERPRPVVVWKRRSREGYRKGSRFISVRVPVLERQMHVTGRKAICRQLRDRHRSGRTYTLHPDVGALFTYAGENLKRNNLCSFQYLRLRNTQ